MSERVAVARGSRIPVKNPLGFGGWDIAFIVFCAVVLAVSSAAVISSGGGVFSSDGDTYFDRRYFPVWFAVMAAIGVSTWYPGLRRSRVRNAALAADGLAAAAIVPSIDELVDELERYAGGASVDRPYSWIEKAYWGSSLVLTEERLILAGGSHVPTEVLALGWHEVTDVEVGDFPGRVGARQRGILLSVERDGVAGDLPMILLGAGPARWLPLPAGRVSALALEIRQRSLAARAEP